MKVNLNSLALPIAAAASLLLASTHTATAQEGTKKEDAPLDEAAMMEAYMKLIAPGPQHKLLKKLVGEWTATQTLWMAPGAPPMENAGTAKFRMAMGGRYLVQSYASEIPGMGKFQGRGTTAYDNGAKEYVQTLDRLVQHRHHGEQGQGHRRQDHRAERRIPRSTDESNGQIPHGEQVRR